MNDEMIVELYLARDETAITQTQALYGNRLKRLSFNIVNNLEDATECENDTYLSAWNSIPPKSPKTYLFSFLAKITRNISINLYNKNHTQKRYAHIVELTQEMEECIPSPSDDEMKISQNVLTETINSFLLSLPSTEREIFVTRYWYAESIKAIAKQFNSSESKVKSILFRTRNKLKKYFEKENFDL
ncbi:MAG: RNA polymerase sigma factor [Oscillospiraceae bacterium]